MSNGKNVSFFYVKRRDEMFALGRVPQTCTWRKLACSSFFIIWKHTNKVVNKSIMCFQENYDRSVNILRQFVAYILSMPCLRLDLRHNILSKLVSVIFIYIFDDKSYFVIKL